MKLKELKTSLAQHSQLKLRFLLPNGAFIPAHAHVTEVGRVDKRFIDCGGTMRSDALCRLQTWVANDVDHRLHAGKLLGILGKAASLLQTDDLDVDIEHEAGVVSQFPLVSAEPLHGELILKLSERHTACLAQDKCKPPAAAPRFSMENVNFAPSCCQP